MNKEYRIVKISALVKVVLEKRAFTEGVTLKEYIKTHFDELLANGIIEPIGTVIEPVLIRDYGNSRARGVAEKL